MSVNKFISGLDDNQRNELITSIKKIGSNNRAEAAQAAMDFAQAIEVPLRKTLLSGDIVTNIFTPGDFRDNPRVMYPLDILVPGQETSHYAYVIPSHGQIPQRRVEGDYLMIPTYRIGSSIDANLLFIQDANWPVIQRMIEILEAGFVKKTNDDGWQTILAAAVDRNILINDPNAAQGQFTPRLVTLMKTFMRRNGGGNTATNNRAKLTHLYVSPEAKDDIRSWDLSLVPDQVRANIYYTSENGAEVMKIYDVEIHDLDELGEDQEYQQYFEDTLEGSTALTAKSDLEIVVGLDRQRNDSFVSPIREDIQIFEDNTVHRQGLFSLYGWCNRGFAVLDSRRVMLGSI